MDFVFSSSSSGFRRFEEREESERERLMELDLENPLTGLQEHQCDTIPALFASESDHMPCKEYLRCFETKDFNFSVRREAISLISQFSCNFDPFISYLAVNYFDRFISRQSLTEAKSWILRLLAMACLSLAAKMKKTELSLTDFQGGGVIFESQTIQRMELLILGALKWRMRSVTPFSFVHFFLSFFKLKDPPLVQALKARTTEILFKAQNEIKLLEFKPSTAAASALLYASHELFPLQFPCFRKAISSCAYVNKEQLVDCYNVIEDMFMDGCEVEYDTLSCSDTPVNVLDRRYSSSESDKTTVLSLGRAIVSSDRDVKRRKISDVCSDNAFQLSQFQHY